MLGRFTKSRAFPRSKALGTFVVGPARPYGYPPTRPGRRIGLGTTPALTGLFQHGNRVVGISQINAMATNIHRGS